MKRTTILEPWTSKEKLCLSSAVLRSGDQNWMSVSRQLRVLGEADRPGEWYAQQQCALQYEALLNNAGATKRKKRSEKGPEAADSPGEAIVRRLVQERLEELYTFLEADKQEYNRLKKEIDDIESGRADDRLDEFEQEMEDDLEREGMQGPVLHLHEERNRPDANQFSNPPQETSHQAPSAESKVPTSPLLTSLLQSPTNYRASSSISMLSPPPARLNDAPTLSRLLESPAKQIEPAVPFQSPVKKEEPEADSQTTPVTELEVLRKEMPEEVVSSVEQPETQELKVEPLEGIQEEQFSQGGVEDKVEQGMLEAEMDSEVQMQEVEVEVNPNEQEQGLPTPPVTVSNDESKEVEGEHEQYVEPEQEQEHEQSMVNLQDSDTMEEQGLAEGELDSQMVNMIVAGEGVITVNHDTSSEHMEGFTSLDIQHKDDSETAESVKEDSLDDIVEISEAGKDGDTGFGSGNMNDSNEGSVPPLEVDQVDTDPPITQSEEAKDKEVEGTVSEVGGETVSVGGSILVEEEVDPTPTVHEVEVLVSQVDDAPGGKEPSDEDSTQDGELKQLIETEPEATPEADNPEETLEESPEEEREPTSPKTSLASKQDHLNSNDDNEQDDNNEDDKSFKDIPSTPSAQSSTKYAEEEEGGPQGSKRRLLSGSASDSKPSSPATPLLEDSKGYRSWKKSVLLVYGRIAAHKNAILFLRPITNEDAPSYDSVILRPIDLSTIKKRIESGELRTTVEFQRDLLIMFQNAIMYNNSRSPVYKMASSMQSECMQHIELMVEAMGEGVAWRKDIMSVDKQLGTRGRGEAPKRKRVSLEEKITPKRRRDAST